MAESSKWFSKLGASLDMKFKKILFLNERLLSIANAFQVVIGYR